jgi:TctA family transporter
VLGAFFGVLPGTGPSIASFGSYMVEKKVSRDPSVFVTKPISLAFIIVTVLIVMVLPAVRNRRGDLTG